MATREIVVDDIDGTEGAETYTFSWQGTNYRVDLSEANAKELEDSLEKYIKAARKETARLPRSGSAPKGNKEELQAIRQWAKDNGYQVSDRGRVSAEIQEAYHKANG